MKKHSLKIFLLSILLMTATTAHADEYMKADYFNLTQGLIRLGALDMRNDKILDEYASIAECDLFVSFYENDFKWQKIRKAIRQSMRQSVETFPTGFYYDTKFQLDRYDFKNKRFNFLGNVHKKAVNTFTLFDSAKASCGGVLLHLLPTKFKLVLDDKVMFAPIPFDEEQAKALLDRMDKAENKNRFVYARFNMRALYANKMAPIEESQNKENILPLTQIGEDGKRGEAGLAAIAAHMESIDYYEDEARTRLIYSYIP